MFVSGVFTTAYLKPSSTPCLIQNTIQLRLSLHLTHLSHLRFRRHFITHRQTGGAALRQSRCGRWSEINRTKNTRYCHMSMIFSTYQSIFFCPPKLDQEFSNKKSFTVVIYVNLMSPHPEKVSNLWPCDIIFLYTVNLIIYLNIATLKAVKVSEVSESWEMHIAAQFLGARSSQVRNAPVPSRPMPTLSLT